MADVKEIIRELFTAAQNEVDASRAALVMFNQTCAKANEILETGDIETAKELIKELNESSAALIAATMQNTPLADIVTTADIQAVADTLPETGNYPADGSTII